jgi:hypothetical protein
MVFVPTIETLSAFGTRSRVLFERVRHSLARHPNIALKKPGIEDRFGTGLRNWKDTAMTSIALGRLQATPARSSRAGGPDLSESGRSGDRTGRTRTRTRLTRRGRVVLTALVVLPLLAGGGALAASSGAFAGIQGQSASSFRYLTVQPGESLWSIAQRVAPRSDPRDVIAAFVDLNGLSSGMVQAGQRLAVPQQFDGAAR